MGKSLVSCFLTHSVYTDDGDDDDDDAEARAATRQIELNHDERNNEPKPVNTRPPHGGATSRTAPH